MHFKMESDSSTTTTETEAPGTATQERPEKGQCEAPSARPASKPKPRRHLPPYHVVLLDDNDHTHEYVMAMLKALFGYPPEQGYTLAQQVDRRGRAIVFTTHKELAELKRDQIHSYGADLHVATCKGSMSAVIEQAEE
jgi:ATP-dependent Clp protease adaptor protein ClpS